MKNFIVFSIEEGPFFGKILRTGSCPSNMVALQASETDKHVIEGIADDVTQYIVDYIVCDRPAFPGVLSSSSIIADGVDGVTISSLPNPTLVMINGSNYEVTDGIFEFTLDIPGKYKILCQAFPYQDKEFEVTAVES